MRINALRLLWIIAALSALAVPPAHSAILILGGPGGPDDPPEPTEGAMTEEDWNPTVTCEAEPGDTIWDLLACLEDRIAHPPPCIQRPPRRTTLPGPGHEGQQNMALQEDYGDGDDCSNPQARHDFYVTILPHPPYGLEILRLDGSEIERITLRENDPGIQTTELRLHAPNHFARIKHVTQTPRGGKEDALYITLNKREIRIPTSRYASSVELTAAMMRRIRDNGFFVTYKDPYLYVTFDRLDRAGITRLQFRSTDPGIVDSDLSLFPTHELLEDAEAPVEGLSRP